MRASGNAPKPACPSERSSRKSKPMKRWCAKVSE
jgi:hypothetical protein